MKKVLFSLGLGFLLSVSSFAQLTGVVMEEVMNSATFYELNPTADPGTYPEGYATYRIFVELQDPTDFLSAVHTIEEEFEVPCSPVEIRANNSFWNSPGGVDVGSSLNSAFFGIIPQLEWDTYVTIGRSQSNDPGGNVFTAGSNFYWGDENNTVNGTPYGNDLYLLSGAWFSFLSDSNGFPTGPNNRVLIGQFTTPVPPVYRLNFEIFNEGNDEDRIYYVGSEYSQDLETNCMTILENSVSGLPLGCNTIDVCNDPTACNYNPIADQDFGCVYPEFCTDPEALNYNANVLCEAECQYPENNSSDCASALALSDNIATEINTFGDLGISEGSCWTGTDFYNTWISFTATGSDYILYFNPVLNDLQYALFDACDGTEMDCGMISTMINGIAFSGLLSGDDYFIVLSTSAENSFEVALNPGYLGCTDENADNFDPQALDNDGSCIFSGCTDPLACNYDASANTDDGSCNLPDGCTDPEASNYDLEALCDNGGCQYNCETPIENDFCENAITVVLNGSYSGSTCCATPSGFTYLTADNEESNDQFFKVNSGSAEDIFYSFQVLSSEMVTIVIFEGDCNTLDEQASCGTVDLCGGYLSNFVNVQPNTDYYFGVYSNDPGSCEDFTLSFNEAQAGCTDPEACNYDASAEVDNGSCILPDGCTNPEALNYNTDALCDDGSCLLTDCTNPNDQEYSICYDNNAQETYYFESLQPGQGFELFFTQGFIETNWDAISFYGGEEVDPLNLLMGPIDGTLDGLVVSSGEYEMITVHIESDGANSCVSDPFIPQIIVQAPCATMVDAVIGCGDPLACNYNPQATFFDNESCLLPDGCTDPIAFNYDPEALCDDGSCDLPILGCTDSEAINYSEEADSDDGSCVYDDCENPDVAQYTICYGNDVQDTWSFQALDEGVDFYLYFDAGGLEESWDYIYFYGGNEVNEDNLLTAPITGDISGLVIGNYGFDAITVLIISDGSVSCGSQQVVPISVSSPCGEMISPIIGCSAPEACNYFSDANIIDDDSCIYPDGCTSPTANNYNPDALCDDGSCDFPIPGCTDPVAINYQEEANLDNGSCFYLTCEEPSEISYNICYESVLEQTWIFEANQSGVAFDLQFIGGEVETSFDVIWVYGGVGINTQNLLFGPVDGDLSGMGVNSSGYDYLTVRISADGAVSCGDGSLDQIIVQSPCATMLDPEIGCDDPEACNYSISANTYDNETCIYPDGCNNPVALNFDPQATCNDGSCIIPGCTDSDACNYNSNATANDSSCIYPDGCTIPNASNYNPLALCNDGSCVFSGCMDPVACNYDENAEIDDSSCIYSGTYIFGVVYDDMNQNDGWNPTNPAEPTLSGWSILVEPNNEIIYTDASGHFSFHAQPEVEYTLSLQDNSEYYDPVESSIGVTIVGSSDCDEQVLNLAVTESMPGTAVALGTTDVWMDDIHCNDGSNPGLWINNIGTEALNGTITISNIEGLNFTDSNFLGSVSPSSYGVGTAQWEIEDHQPGEQTYYQCHVVGPGVNFINETMTVVININLTDDEGNEVYNVNYILNPTVVCAYDPNDKYAIPEGYAEPHFILAEDEIEYRIRFQNTGNYPAEDIIIRDTLDIAHLDLTSFTPRYASHSFMTCVQLDEGVVDFIFENIMLPDSSADFEGSQGYVVYSIRPKVDILPGDVIENTAYIYFEENPAIVTNTTWHTIYDCNELNVLGDAVSACQNEAPSIEVEYPYIERFDWWVDELIVDSDGGNSFDLSTLDPGDYTIGLTAENPLCEAFSTSDVSIYEVPVADFSADDAVLTAADGDSWQWYFNGEEIDGAIDQSYTASESGNYSVMITNANDCSDISVEQNITIIGVEEHNAVALSIFPNPATDLVNIKLSGNIAPERIEIYDQTGKLVLSKSIMDAEKFISIDCSHLASGFYIVNITDINGKSISNKIEIK